MFGAWSIPKGATGLPEKPEGRGCWRRPWGATIVVYKGFGSKTTGIPAGIAAVRRHSSISTDLYPCTAEVLRENPLFIAVEGAGKGA